MIWIGKVNIWMQPRWQIQPCDLREMKQVMTRWQRELEGRHRNGIDATKRDEPRSVSPFGHDGLSPR